MRPCLILILFVLTAMPVQAETQQRIDYGTAGIGIDTYYTDAELFTTKTEDNIDQDSPIFWVKVSQLIRSNTTGKVKSEIISIREFPTVEYRKVLRQLKTVRNMDSSRVYRTLNLCDSGGYSVRLDKKTQYIIDICGADPSGLEKVDGRMLAAIRMLRILVRKTLRNPDSSYRRR